MPSVRAVCWVFTLNNWTQDEYTSVATFLSDRSVVRYGIVGKETGENNTPHLQGYVHFVSRVTFGAAKSFISERAHLEQARGGDRANQTYCSKGGDYVEFGRAPVKKVTRNEQATDFRDALAASGADGVQDYADHNPGVFYFSGHSLVRNALFLLRPINRPNIKVTWIWGFTGIGKSHYAWSQYPKAYSKEPRHKWWTGYLGEKEVIIDDFGKDNIDITYLLRWFDKYPVSVENKGGQVGLHADTFIVTSNFKPADVYPFHPQLEALERRIKLCTIVDHELVEE